MLANRLSLQNKPEQSPEFFLGGLVCNQITKRNEKVGGKQAAREIANKK